MSILSVLKDGNTNTSAIIFQAKIRTDIQENLNSMMLWTKLVSYQTALIEACMVCKTDENLLVLSAEQLRLQSSNCSILTTGLQGIQVPITGGSSRNCESYYVLQDTQLLPDINGIA